MKLVKVVLLPDQLGQTHECIVWGCEGHVDTKHTCILYLHQIMWPIQFSPRAIVVYISVSTNYLFFFHTAVFTKSC